MMEQTKTENKAFLLVTIVFMALALRAPLTGVGSLVALIQADLGLSAFMAGIITTIPLIAFAAISPLTAGMAQRTGAGRLLTCAYAVGLVGVLLRSSGNIGGLYCGTLLVGVGIAVGNVLLPAIVKEKYPERVQAMTALYTTLMVTSGGMGSAASAPLAGKFGWQMGLGVWAVLMVLAFVFILFNNRLTINKPVEKSKGSLLKNRLAICVAFYMGLQSLIFYCCVAWLPSILAAKGWASEAAGFGFAIYQAVGITMSFLAPFLAKLGKDQRLLTALNTAIYFVGLIIVLVCDFTPLVILGLVMAGVSSGGCLSLALLFIGLRTENAADAARLSGMSQSVGYLIAAFGPMLLGLVYDLTLNWNYPMIILLFCMFIMFCVGFVASSNRKI